MTGKLKITGTASQLHAAREIISEYEKEFSAPKGLVAVGDDTSDISPVSRRPMGMEALEYFFVVFSAHLAAGFTLSGLLTYIRSRASAKGVHIKVDEEH